MDLHDTFLVPLEDEANSPIPIARLFTCNIGRALMNDLIIDDQLVSREHAQLRRDALGQCTIVDLGARNRTTVNGMPIFGKTTLHNGDVITIGSRIFRLLQDTPPTDPPVTSMTMIAREWTTATILVIDIRGFSQISNMLGDERITEFVQAFNTGMAEILREHQCWSHKFIGDAVMALWVHSGPRIGRSDILRLLDVIAQARDLCRSLHRTFNLSTPLRIGCGVNSGQLMISNIAGGRGFDVMPVGDVVNKAFRFESATKVVGCDILLGRELFVLAAEEVVLADLPDFIEVSIKGYGQLEKVLAIKMEGLGSLSQLILGLKTSHEGI